MTNSDQAHEQFNDVIDRMRQADPDWPVPIFVSRGFIDFNGLHDTALRWFEDVALDLMKMGAPRDDVVYCLRLAADIVEGGGRKPS